MTKEDFDQIVDTDNQEADDFRGACASCGAAVSYQVVDPARAYDVNDTDVIEKPKPQWMPEVGEWCNVTIDEGVFECLIIGRDEDLVIFRSGGHYPHGAYDGATLNCFTPIKTEREIFVESVVEKLIELDSDNWTHDANFIYDWLVGRGVDLSPLLEGKDNE
jgi:hypothetical protein